VEDITETFHSTRRTDDAVMTEGKEGAPGLIQEVSPVSSESCHSRRHIPKSFRMLNQSFRRAKSVRKLEEPLSEELTFGELNSSCSIQAVEESSGTGTQTLDQLGWSLRRANSEIPEASPKEAHGQEMESNESAVGPKIKEASEKDLFREHLQCEEIPEASPKEVDGQEMESNEEGKGNESAIGPKIKEASKKDLFRDPLLCEDMVGEIEILRKPTAAESSKPQAQCDDDNAKKIQPEILKPHRKPVSGAPESIEGSSLLTEDICRAKHPGLPSLEREWPSAEGLHPLEKVSETKERNPVRRWASRRKLKGQGSNESTGRAQSFRKMLSFRSIGSFRSIVSFRTNDSKVATEIDHNDHRGRGLFRLGSRRSSRKIIHQRLKSRASESASSSDAIASIIKEDSKMHASPLTRKPTLSKSTAGPEDLYPTKLEERKSFVARDLSKCPLNHIRRFSGMKKASSLQAGLEKTTKNTDLQERKALLSRLTRRTVSLPTARSDEKTVQADEFSVDAAASGVPQVVTMHGRDSVVSSLGQQEKSEGPVKVVLCRHDSSLVSSLLESRGTIYSGDGAASVDHRMHRKVPSVIACVPHTNGLEESLGQFSFDGRGKSVSSEEEEEEANSYGAGTEDA